MQSNRTIKLEDEHEKKIIVCIIIDNIYDDFDRVQTKADYTSL